MSIFSAYAQYYELLYGDKNYHQEVAYVHNLLLKYGPVKKLLEFGSGTGKHGSLLAKMGYLVHGVEKSKDMISQSTLVNGFSCEEGDITTIDLHKTYDAILALFHVISYQTENIEIQRVFSNAHKHLAAGGLFIFDFWYSPAVYSQQPVVRVKRMSNDFFQVTRIAEPVILSNQNKVDVNYTIYSHDISSQKTINFQERHSMRHFSLPELEFIGSTMGFEIINAEEFMTGKFPGNETWNVCVVFRKK